MVQVTVLNFSPVPAIAGALPVHVIGSDNFYFAVPVVAVIEDICLLCNCADIAVVERWNLVLHDPISAQRRHATCKNTLALGSGNAARF